MIFWRAMNEIYCKANIIVISKFQQNKVIIVIKLILFESVYLKCISHWVQKYFQIFIGTQTDADKDKNKGWF